MNIKQERFLKEFHALMEKYNIHSAGASSGCVVFKSNESVLEFSHYEEGEYRGIHTGQELFIAKE